MFDIGIIIHSCFSHMYTPLYVRTCIATYIIHTPTHKQFLNWWTPILAVSCVGVAVGVAFLVTGCVFCVCRCCGKCGGGYSMKQSHDCTTCSCTFLLLFLTLGLLLVSYSSTPHYVPYMGLLLVVHLTTYLTTSLAIYTCMILYGVELL